MPRCQHAIATTMTLLMPLVVVVCASVARLAADTFANDSQAEVASLVAELGAPEFFRRERATEKLLKIGLPAVSLLEQGAGHHDREIRYRCRRILVLVHENDRRNRLDAFVAGSHNEDDLDLPGWSQFASRFGSRRGNDAA
jgi:hypothetical protein